MACKSKKLLRKQILKITAINTFRRLSVSTFMRFLITPLSLWRTCGTSQHLKYHPVFIKIDCIHRSWTYPYCTIPPPPAFIKFSGEKSQLMVLKILNHKHMATPNSHNPLRGVKTNGYCYAGIPNDYIVFNIFLLRLFLQRFRARSRYSLITPPWPTSG